MAVSIFFANIAKIIIIMKNRILLSALALLTVFAGFAWGQKGHDVVAYIAETHLTPTTKAAVESALDGKSMVYYANWLDDASNTPQYSYSKTWHYKNIDAGIKYEDMPLNPKGDVVTAINEQINKLKSKKLSSEEEALALKMIIHLVGDIHQPMHMGHLSDLGGNKVYVKYFGRDRKLHGIWDTDLVESVHNWSYTEWQQQIDRLSEDAVKVLCGKTPDDWAKETFHYATMVYDQTPDGAKISYDYLRFARPIIEQQLLYGGIRLADVLNSIYDQEYK